MISFLIALAVLLIGFLTYGRLVEKIFSPDDRQTPAIAINDGVDCMPIKTWKALLIQLLNIAGTGPIFGALMGACFGPVVFLWIVLGAILAGAVHDYMVGMISERHKGASIAELCKIYINKKIMYYIMRVFAILLLLLTGTVFVTSPAALISSLTPEFFGNHGGMLFIPQYHIPEISFSNLHPKNLPIWPFMFVTVACGAISGFHATQSPMMSKCITSEKEGRKVFYGAMILESVIALIWAAAGVAFYGETQILQETLSKLGQSGVVYDISTKMLGGFGGLLAIIGVVICPITSGDTAFRSARLILAEWTNLEQKNIKNRLILTIPLLLVSAVLTQLDFNVLWRYFSWSNQTLAMVALWMATIYLLKNNKNWIGSLITALPASFMTAVSVTYILLAPEGFKLPASIGYPVGIAVALIAFVLYVIKAVKEEKIIKEKANK